VSFGVLARASGIDPFPCARPRHPRPAGALAPPPVETGELLGKFIMPRPQGLDQACTIHNYNVVPLRNKSGKPRYVLVAGNYMSGISVVDFTNPAAAQEIAYADPPAFPDGFEGGDWSTSWYNG
jgi:hypothetical protein